MNARSFGQSEHSRLQDIVADLQAEGWVIITEPSAQDLPAGLRDLHLDIVATRDGELLLAEVVNRRTAQRDRLDEIARRVSAIPNARFEVFWLGASSQTSPPFEKIKNLVADARAITAITPSGALLLAWAALEGSVLRYAKDVQGLDGWNSPWQLIASLYSDGHIAEGEYLRLSSLWSMRNEIAHNAGANTHVPTALDVEFILTNAERFATRRHVTVDEMVSWYAERYDDPGDSVEVGLAEEGSKEIRGGNIETALMNAFPDATQESIAEAIPEARRRLIVKVANQNPDWGPIGVHTHFRLMGRHDISLNVIRDVLSSIAPRHEGHPL